MVKDWIIIVVLIIGILGGNIWLENRTKTSVDGMVEKLNTLKESMQSVMEEEQELPDITKQVQEVKQYWESQYAALSFFVEHEELEKVNTQLVEIEGNVFAGEYKQAMPNLENCSFVLYHIKEKHRVALKNIF